MKIDRLLGMIMYLLNRDVVSARELAEEFEVSVRTIQRDIDSLTVAGIPIYSVQGSDGGYAIMDNFKLDKQIMDLDDYFFIIKALKSLSSAYENKKIDQALEKVSAIVPEEKDTTINNRALQLNLDLSVVKEPPGVDDYLSLVQTAIEEQKVVEFEYTSANHNQTCRQVEPLSLTFKWYAWYLFSFCRLREDYRLFRLSRIRNLKLLEEGFTRQEDNLDQLLAEYFNDDQREYIDLKLLCDEEIRVSIEDYFANGDITEENDDSFILEISLPKNERYWFGMLLSYGAKVKVLEPPSLQERIVEKAKELENLY